MTMQWGYEKNNGPEIWPKLFPQSTGELQSPIDIKTCETKNYNASLDIHYGQKMTPMLSNTGHGWTIKNCGNDKKIVGGPLQGTYILEQFHCHWGENDGNGSEHTIDGQGFAGELHLVHWNSSKYKSFEQAVNHSDGLAVLAIFLKIGKPNSELQKIVKFLPNVTYKSQEVQLDNTTNINLNNLLPSKLDHWNYDGSLTTPPFNESVSWIVFKEPIEVSAEQLQAFRELRTYSKGEKQKDTKGEGRLIRNVRPVQCVGSRVIRDCGGH